MTIEERLSRIEHVSAGTEENRKKDREEARALWRSTQLQIHEITMKLADLADETRNAHDKLWASHEELRKSIKETDERLGKRIEDLVSAIGKFISYPKSDEPPSENT